MAKENKQIPVVEIFGPTMQGEGLVVGMRTVFIRFGLCDYECKMCDSLHAVLPDRVRENARWITQKEIASEVIDLCARTNCTWVTFSGGNPCIHDLTWLCEELLDAGLYITVETQGTKAPDWLFRCSYVCVSPKSPGMGEKFEQDKFSHFIQKFEMMPGFFVKIVVFSEQDLEFAQGIAELVPNLLGTGRFWLSLGNPYPPGKDSVLTEDGLNLQAELVKRYEILFDDIKGHPYLKYARFLPQIHVLIWGNKQGV